MKKNFFILITLIFALVSCTKEVKIDIPGFEQKLVVDGRIETGMPPIVILSKSQDIYSATNAEAYVASFVNDAEVYINDGNSEYQLDLLCSSNFPPSTQELIAGFLGIPIDQVASLNFCIYSSTNSALFGQTGTTYNLRIKHQGNEYTAQTHILEEKNLNSVWFEEEPSTPGYGFSYASLSDQAGVYDAYMWEVKRINTVNGEVIDPSFKATFSPVFDDNFVDGQTFDFYYENPWTSSNDSIPEESQGKFKIGDTVVIKFSKIDQASFDFIYSKVQQTLSNGNPFASAINVKSNMQGGCLGAWLGYAPTYDTLICQ